MQSDRRMMANQRLDQLKQQVDATLATQMQTQNKRIQRPQQAQQGVVREAAQEGDLDNLEDEADRSNSAPPVLIPNNFTNKPEHFYEMHQKNMPTDFNMNKPIQNINTDQEDVKLNQDFTTDTTLQGQYQQANQQILQTFQTPLGVGNQPPTLLPQASNPGLTLNLANMPLSPTLSFPVQQGVQQITSNPQTVSPIQMHLPLQTKAPFFNQQTFNFEEQKNTDGPQSGTSTPQRTHTGVSPFTGQISPQFMANMSSSSLMGMNVLLPSPSRTSSQTNLLNLNVAPQGQTTLPQQANLQATDTNTLNSSATVPNGTDSESKNNVWQNQENPASASSSNLNFQQTPLNGMIPAFGNVQTTPLIGNLSLHPQFSDTTTGMDNVFQPLSSGLTAEQMSLQNDGLLLNHESSLPNFNPGINRTLSDVSTISQGNAYFVPQHSFEAQLSPNGLGTIPVNASMNPMLATGMPTMPGMGMPAMQAGYEYSMQPNPVSNMDIIMGKPYGGNDPNTYWPNVMQTPFGPSMPTMSYDMGEVGNQPGQRGPYDPNMNAYGAQVNVREGNQQNLQTPVESYGMGMNQMQPFDQMQYRQGRGGNENNANPVQNNSQRFRQNQALGEGFDTRNLSRTNITLMDLVKRELVEKFARDQHGSRHIQNCLEQASLQEKIAVFKQIEKSALSLCEDVFGNYVIQKFFEHGTEHHRIALAKILIGRVLPLTKSMYGCRVVQKAFECVAEELRVTLVSELQGHVEECVRDQNGNHVIQKAIEEVPVEHLNFIVETFHGKVYEFSTHPYGCRVIQRLLERCSLKQKEPLLQEILKQVATLSKDQYGNYVVQHVLQHGSPGSRKDIIHIIGSNILQMSKHKFSSNVVEKCFVHATDPERDILLDFIMGFHVANPPIIQMVRDQYGNYVIQKVLEVTSVPQRNKLINRIMEMVPNLRKLMFGKHIIAKIERITGKHIR